MIQYGELIIQDLRNDKKVKKRYFKNHRLNSIVQSQFLLSHDRSQSKMERICFEKDSCEDICVPNGNIARYTCFCYHEPASCRDYGHHSFDIIKNVPEPEVSPPPEPKNQVEFQPEVTETYINDDSV